MSWHAQGVGDKVIVDLEANCKQTYFSENSKDIISNQICLIKSVLKCVPEDHVAIVEATGHVDHSSVFQKVEVRIYKK
jgi:hypothetical protein